MAQSNTPFRDGKVTTEGDDLYYKVRGAGKPLLFIAPAGGNGDGYFPVARRLADRYKVITYDRRANTRSTKNFPKDFSVRQQSRDAVAVLNAAGETSAFVFGNSSGAVIALDLAAAFPEAVDGAVIHEAPVPALLPQEEAEKWAAFFRSCYDLGRAKGASKGAMRFFFGVELPAVGLMLDTLKVLKYMRQEPATFPVERIPSKEGTDILIFNELLPITGYRPDVDALRQSGAKLYIAVSQYGAARNTWYARAAKILAEQLPCPLVTFPGHHGSFMGDTGPWTAALGDIIQQAGW
jgi:pimeloyl-ACP methyl ester carboxylesterase